MEGVIQDFLGQTKYGQPMPPDVLHEIQHGNEAEQYGDPQQGYQWKRLFLRNGTELRMKYKGDEYFADVKDGQVIYDGVRCSPAQFVSCVANQTNRSAWRDIWIRFPEETEWHRADELRNENSA